MALTWRSETTIKQHIGAPLRRRDDSVELLDEDEFALHQVELGYPARLIQHAERMADHVLSAVRTNVEPFAGEAALEWMTRRTDSPTGG